MKLNGRATDRVKGSLESLGAFLRASALVDSSRQHYRHYWKQWTEWCRWMEFSCWLTNSDYNTNITQLGAFAVYLWRFGMNKKGVGNSYSTMCSKLCAVRWYHRNNAGYDSGVDATHTILLRGIRSHVHFPGHQAVAAVSLLPAIHFPPDESRARSHALAVGWPPARSEYLLMGNRCGGAGSAKSVKMLDPTYHCCACKPHKAQRVGISLLGAENNQFGRERVRFHDKSGDTVICPVAGARWIIKGAHQFNTTPDQPALSTGRGTGIAAKELAVTIKAAAQEHGLDPARFSTHSVRVGGATALLNAGADRLSIKVMFLGFVEIDKYQDVPKSPVKLAIISSRSKQHRF
ncbi:LOW QUALITY PROTEIN: hypothetical protein PHMEG_00015136 [Phytophthora megakarya]|uniref:Tyr recombinase domain-containing protein n=1 Tax=Phytophthora megakarya TaxID=4795 RepID=A0A225W287_9STRA|nr:LOW QUALITY PROTEIN: hypothetical protein PHMEG_00015136 [Phytophthora megakarya]